MPKIQNSLQPRGLLNYRVLVEDTNPSSLYFSLAQVPSVLTSGKNAFLINGSDELQKDTEILIEILDSNGDTVFNQPIKNYQEGLARVVSIEVYEDTPPGLGSLTIMGQLTRLRDGTPIPPEWQGVYNVRWTIPMNIDPLRPNTTPIRLYETPQLYVS